MKASEPLARRCCGRDYMPVNAGRGALREGHCALRARLEGRAQAKKAVASSGSARNFSQLPITALLLWFCWNRSEKLDGGEGKILVWR
jgi:hypothetical protein